jgi:hypothetical protein
MYEVGFKDVYPWVWSVMLGVSLMLAERRGAFQSTGAHSSRVFWLKNISAVFLNVVVPAFFFGLTMIRLGPKYSQNMNLQQILGTLYLAGAPLEVITCGNSPPRSSAGYERISFRNPSVRLVAWLHTAIWSGRSWRLESQHLHPSLVGESRNEIAIV